MSRYGRDITGLLDQMKTMAGPGGFTDTPSFRIITIIIDEVASRLNYSPSLAAQIVGRMNIMVSNEVFEDSPAEVSAFVSYATDAFISIVKGIEAKYGVNAGVGFAEASASRMSITLG